MVQVFKSRDWSITILRYKTQHQTNVLHCLFKAWYSQRISATLPINNLDPTLTIPISPHHTTCHQHSPHTQNPNPLPPPSSS